MEKITCIECKKDFEVHRYRKDTARFCNHKCYSKNKIGRSMNRKNISRLDLLKRNLEKNTIKKDGCWEWKAHINKGGYAQLTCRYDKTKVKLAHRASYIVHKGEIAENMQVNHLCHNPVCTNPEHLYLGSQKENMSDKVIANRQAKGNKIHTSKLNANDVIDIRSKLEKGVTPPEISKEYRISKENVYAIRDSKTWKHLQK